MSWDDFRTEVVQSLQGVPSFACTAMGKGHGLLSGATFFGMIERGRLYFRVDDESRPAYEAAGCGPFRVKGGLVENYYEVPFEVREDPLVLREWANLAILAAEQKPA